ncbi:hypothetical protein L2E82_29061 [Cichorium intybus]|uniref:Uncharacterized protein n=1 Tax=Cichorium intybus TaxID=13427 RepID=A0ACB9CX33_CICIN|nr:hypothetical protein L2E82_29061 [Cichorium intybus]
MNLMNRGQSTELLELHSSDFSPTHHLAAESHSCRTSNLPTTSIVRPPSHSVLTIPSPSPSRDHSVSIPAIGDLLPTDAASLSRPRIAQKYPLLTESIALAVSSGF